MKRDHPGFTVDQVNTEAEIHTFDAQTLSKVGRAVMLVLSGQEQRLVSREAKSTTPNHSGQVAGFDTTGEGGRLAA